MTLDRLISLVKSRLPPSLHGYVDQFVDANRDSLLAALAAKNIAAEARTQTDDHVDRVAYDTSVPKDRRQWAIDERDRRLSAYRAYLQDLPPLALLEIPTLLATRRFDLGSIGVIGPRSRIFSDAIRAEYDRRGAGFPGSVDATVELNRQDREARGMNSPALSAGKKEQMARRDEVLARASKLSATARYAVDKAAIQEVIDGLPTDDQFYGHRTTMDLSRMIDDSVRDLDLAAERLAPKIETMTLEDRQHRNQWARLTRGQYITTTNPHGPSVPWSNIAADNLADGPLLVLDVRGAPREVWQEILTITGKGHHRPLVLVVRSNAGPEHERSFTYLLGKSETPTYMIGAAPPQPASIDTVIDADISARSERRDEGTIGFRLMFRGKPAAAGARIWADGDIADVHARSLAEAKPDIEAIRKVLADVRRFSSQVKKVVDDDEWLKARGRQHSLEDRVFSLLGSAGEMLQAEIGAIMERRDAERPAAKQAQRDERDAAFRRQQIAEWDERWGNIDAATRSYMNAPCRPLPLGDAPKVTLMIASGYLLAKHPKAGWHAVAVGSDAELDSLKKYMESSGILDVGDAVRAQHGAGTPVMARRTPAEVRKMYVINHRDRRIPLSWRQILDRGGTPPRLRPVDDVIGDL